MGIFNFLKKQEKSVPNIDPIKEVTRDGLPKAYIPKFLYKPPFGYPRYVDLPNVRRLASMPYVDMCITTIVDEMSAIEWDIVPREGVELTSEIQAQIDHVKSFFENPNSNKESFEEIRRKYIRDILEVDAGVINKIFNLKGEMVEIVARDGSTFTKNPDIFGMLTDREDLIQESNIAQNNKEMRLMEPGWITAADAREKAAYFQYGWITGARPVPFGKKEIVWLERNPRTDSIYGRSPVEILGNTIQTLIYAIEHNLEYFNDNSIPKGIIGLEGADADEIRAFQSQWKEQQRTKDSAGNWKKIFHHVPIVGTTPQFTRLQFTNAELELLEGQKWWAKLVWACFGVTSVELGYTEDAKGLANQIVQSNVFKKRAINPLLRLEEYRINHEILPEFEYPDIEFKFLTFDVDEETKKAQLYQLQLNAGYRSINEVRLDEGLDEVDWGDKQSAEEAMEMQQRYSDPFAQEQSRDEEESKPEEKKNEKSFELKFKYIKRTGSHGNYTYWYRDPRGKLVSGKKPGENNILSKEQVEKFPSSDEVLSGNEKYSNDLDSPFEEKEDVQDLKERLVKLSKKEGYINLNHGSKEKGVLENYKRREGDSLKEMETYGNGLYLAVDKDYSITKDAPYKHKVPIDTETLKKLLPIETFEEAQIRAFKSVGEDTDKESFKMRARALGYNDKQIEHADAWAKKHKEEITAYDPNNFRSYFGETSWEEYDFPSIIFEVGLKLRGYSGILDMQKNITLIDPDLKMIHSSILTNGAEKKALQTEENPLILREFETINEDRLEKSIIYLLKQNEKKIKDLIEKEAGKDTIKEIKSLPNLVKAIKGLLEFAGIKAISDAVIKNNFLKGWDSAEKQLSKNFIVNKEAIDFIQDYTFNNIKGMTEEIANDLRQELERGIMAGEGISKIKSRVSKVFDVGENRAEMISRTESNRAENQGKLQAFKSSGEEYNKQWISKIDSRTSPICKRLNGKVVKMDENFKDSQSGWEGPCPPSHVNCRSSIIFIAK